MSEKQADYGDRAAPSNVLPAAPVNALSNPTQPEAAALRDVLRRIRNLCERMAGHIPVESAVKSLLDQIQTAAHRALERPQTNDKVIDELQDENARLQNQVLDLQVAVHEAKLEGNARVTGRTLPPVPAELDRATDRISSLIHALTGRRLLK